VVVGQAHLRAAGAGAVAAAVAGTLVAAAVACVTHDDGCLVVWWGWLWLKVFD